MPTCNRLKSIDNRGSPAGCEDRRSDKTVLEKGNTDEITGTDPLVLGPKRWGLKWRPFGRTEGSRMTSRSILGV